MKVKFHGVRGSIPVCDKEFQRYGGNTTCLEIHREAVNRIVIFDAGTGIRNCGKELVARKIRQSHLNILFSHFHWDHIQGFPFFAPAYVPDQNIGIYVMGEKRKTINLKEIFAQQMQEDFFPVKLDSMGAEFSFMNFSDEETLFGAHIIAQPQFHKYLGGSYGFRIEDDSVTLTICTDLEHVDGIDENVITLARNADLLIHDGQYTPEEYRTVKKGWGHSTWEQAVDVAVRANVKKLVITHHDPDHNDDLLESMENECRKVFPNSVFAREGMEIQV